MSLKITVYMMSSFFKKFNLNEMVKMLSSKNVTEETKLNPVIFLKEFKTLFTHYAQINTFM